jgi:hypothetical protein
VLGLTFLKEYINKLYMQFDDIINSLLNEDEVSKADKIAALKQLSTSTPKSNRFLSSTYAMEVYDLELEELASKVEEFGEGNPNIWDYFLSLQTEEEVDAFMREIM